MNNRIIWLIVALAGIFGLILCGVLVLGGMFVYREVAGQPTPTAEVVVIATTRPTTTEEDPSPTAEAATPAAETTATANASPAPAETITAVAEVTAPALPPDTAIGDLGSSLTPAGQALLVTFPGGPEYQINATFDPLLNQINGSMRLRFQNTEPISLTDVYLRLYANASFYNEGGIEVQDVQLDGRAAITRLETNDTALRIVLPQPLEPGQPINLTMRFVTSIPTSGGGYGIFGVSNGVYALYNWFPELAVYENGGWLLNPVDPQGDPTNTDTASYRVAVQVPENFMVVSSGTETSATTSTGTTYTMISALTRNFVMVISDQFVEISRAVGDTSINSYALAGSEASNQTALDAAAQAITLFNTTFGPYPYQEIDIAEAMLGNGAAGMEATGLIMVGDDYYDQSNARPFAGIGSSLPGSEEFNILEYIVAHEVAHQWWYSTVGSDAYAHPWIDESITNWSSAYYLDQVRGNEVGALARDAMIESTYRAELAQGDTRLDQPVDQFTGQQYEAIVYGKGAIMYDVLRKELGDELFFAFLRQYYTTYQFKRATGDDWKAVLADVAGQERADAFYAKWVEGNSITSNDLPPPGPISSFFSGLSGDATPTPAP